jgi:predicted transcriptional regulator
MKALSLKQPYAELILEGKKKIELRKWNTNFRGEFFVHASKNPDKESMKRFGFATLPLGALVGKANLVDVKIYNNEEEHSKDNNLHLASSYWGNNGFVLENPTRISPIIPFKGQLNFFETNLE